MIDILAWVGVGLGAAMLYGVFVWAPAYVIASTEDKKLILRHTLVNAAIFHLAYFLIGYVVWAVAYISS